MMPGEQRFVMDAPFVTTDAGTGLVHMAPAHGQEDYELWRDAGRLRTHGIMSPVDDYGRFVVNNAWGLSDIIRTDLKQLHGLDALSCGTQRILEFLSRHHVLLSEQPYTHSYPHTSNGAVVCRSATESSCCSCCLAVCPLYTCLWASAAHESRVASVGMVHIETASMGCTDSRRV